MLQLWKRDEQAAWRVLKGRWLRCGGDLSTRAIMNAAHRPSLLNSTRRETAAATAVTIYTPYDSRREAPLPTSRSPLP